MCGGGEIFPILFSVTFPDLLPDSSSDHDITELLHLPGSEEHCTRDHLPPPVALALCLCPHVGTFSHTAPAGEDIRAGPDTGAVCLLISAGPHAQSLKVKDHS